MILLTVYCIDKHTNCPICGFPMKKDGKRTRTIIDYNKEKERFEKITLFSQRYICKNPDCRHILLSGIPLGKSAHTEAFDQQFAYRIFSWGFDTFTQSEKIFGLSRTILSNITYRCLKDLHLHFRPPQFLEVLYLCPFTYQSIKRYYLGAVDKCGNHILLEFFGYKNSKEEALRYFQFLWGERDDIYSQTCLLVDTDCEFIYDLYTCFYNLYVLYIPDLLDKKIDSYMKDTKDLSLNTSALFITRLKNMLKASDPKKDFFERSRDLKRWWKEGPENTKRQMEELWNTLGQGAPEIFMSYMYQCLKFAAVDQRISVHRLNNTPFEIMVARMMYASHDEYIFTEEEEDILDEEDAEDAEDSNDTDSDAFSGKLPRMPGIKELTIGQYTDKSTGIFYRQPRHYSYTRSYFPWNRELVPDFTDVDITELLEEFPFSEVDILK